MARFDSGMISIAVAAGRISYVKSWDGRRLDARGQPFRNPVSVPSTVLRNDGTQARSFAEKARTANDRAIRRADRDERRCAEIKADRRERRQARKMANRVRGTQNR